MSAATGRTTIATSAFLTFGTGMPYACAIASVFALVTERIPAVIATASTAPATCATPPASLAASLSVLLSVLPEVCIASAAATCPEWSDSACATSSRAWSARHRFPRIPNRGASAQ